MDKFDYVRYDKKHIALQNEALNLVRELDAFIQRLSDERSIALRHRDNFELQSRFDDYLCRSMDKLEECYAMIGKAIRDRQMLAGGSQENVKERG